MILEKIKEANDVKQLSLLECEQLAQEIRDFLIRSLSETGGHLASNLGVVELTIALHRFLHFPEDKLVWDVGHQAYTHKILTGRKEQFATLRKTGGLSGFPKRQESDCDAFDTGHSSTSISAGLGLVQARDLKGENYQVVSVIGDGALTGGMAYEALNNAAELKKNFIIILNDNEMSITRNVGGMSSYLDHIRMAAPYTELKMGVTNALKKIPKVGDGMVDALHKTKSSIKQLVIPGMLFENMGIAYFGPIDGHDIYAMIQAINRAKHMEGPVLLHVITKKGKGYPVAESNPEKFHGIDPFDIATGNPLKAKKTATYTEVFSNKLLELARKDERIVGITAAMPSGTGLSAFKNAYPKRFFDVGIAEEYAVTFAAGMAASGMRPVFAVYSSFLQRGYDQVLHDVCIQKLPVFFCVDRSGLVGADGETHQGIFDISYLGHIPNLTLMAPKNRYEMEDMMEFGFQLDGPVAMKYPRGAAYDGLEEYREPIVLGKSEIIQKGEEVVILSVGNMMEECVQAVELLKNSGIQAGLVNVRFIRPMDEEILHQLAEEYGCIVTVEENQLTGGYGQMVSAFLHRHQYSNDLLSFGIPDCFVEHATVQEQRALAGIDARSIASRILEKVKKK